MSITCKSLDHIYGYNTPFEYYALKNVNLKIEKGSFTAIIGQTGSGKSTLIQHINALLLPTSGEIKIDDYIISQNNKPQNLKSLRKKSGLVFQFPEYQLFEETIERDIMFGPMNFGIDENRAKEIELKMISDELVKRLNNNSLKLEDFQNQDNFEQKLNVKFVFDTISDKWTKMKIKI